MKNVASWNKSLPQALGMIGGRARRGYSSPFSQGGPHACCWSQAWFNISLQLLANTWINKDTGQILWKVNKGALCSTGEALPASANTLSLQMWRFDSQIELFLFWSHVWETSLCVESPLFTLKSFFLYSLLGPVIPGGCECLLKVNKHYCREDPDLDIWAMSK